MSHTAKPADAYLPHRKSHSPMLTILVAQDLFTTVPLTLTEQRAISAFVSP